MYVWVYAACWGERRPDLLANALDPTNFFPARFAINDWAPPAIPYRHLIATCPGASSASTGVNRRPRRVQRSLVLSPSPASTPSSRHYVCFVAIRLQCLQRRYKKDHDISAVPQWLDRLRASHCTFLEKRFQYQHLPTEGQGALDSHQPRIRVPRRSRSRRSRNRRQRSNCRDRIRDPPRTILLIHHRISRRCHAHALPSRCSHPMVPPPAIRPARPCPSRRNPRPPRQPSPNPERTPRIHRRDRRPRRPHLA